MKAKLPGLQDFKLLFEHTPTPILVLDPQLKIVAANEAYLQSTMTERREIVGKEIFHVFPDNPDDPSADGVLQLRESLARAIATRKPDAMAVQKYDIRLPESDGGGFVVRYWSPLNVPVVKRNKVKYVIHRVIDVTEAVQSMQRAPSGALAKSEKNVTGEWELLAEFIRKETAAISALRQKQLEFQSIVNLIPPLVWTADASGYIYWYNDRWYQYTGKTAAEMEGWGWQAVHDPKMLPEVMRYWKESLDTGKPFSMEFPLRSATGEFRWFLTRVAPVRDKSGQITQWFGTNTDVDDIRRTRDRLLESENRLRISEERMRLAQKAAQIGAWEFDFDRDEYFFTEQAAEILGRSTTLRHVAEADFLAMMYVAADREAAVKAMRSVQNKKREYDVSFRVQKQDGSWRWISARGVPFFNQGRNIMIGVFIDVTDARNAQPEAAGKVSALA